MKRRLLFLLTLVIVLAGCGKSEKARQELARLNVDYTEANFIDNAREGNAEVVKHFLDAGMGTEVKTKDGQTALMVAALANKVDVVKLLLDHGADVNAKNKFNGTALMSAAWKGNAEVVELCSPHGPDLSIKDNRGMTALMFAAWENHPAIVRALLNKGAEVRCERRKWLDRTHARLVQGPHRICYCFDRERRRLRRYQHARQNSFEYS